MKTCKTCNTSREESEFRIHHRTCKKCEQSREKQRRLDNKLIETPEEAEKRKEQQRLYYRKRLSDPEIRKKKRQNDYLNHLKHPEKELFRRAKQRAIKKGLKFTITIDDIIIPEFCPVFKTPMRLGGNPHNSPSLDRIDSNKGYTKDNIMVISYRANTLKNNSTPDEIEMLYNFYCRISEDT